jgi:hypothetical protein
MYLKTALYVKLSVNVGGWGFSLLIGIIEEFRRVIAARHRS